MLFSVKGRICSIGKARCAEDRPDIVFYPNKRSFPWVWCSLWWVALLALAKGVVRGAAAKILGMHRAQSKPLHCEEVSRLESVARGVGMPVVDCCQRPQNCQGN